MARLVLGRSVYALILLFLASIAVFYGMRVAPGDVANVLANPLNGNMGADAIRKQLRLDDPLVVQYLRYIGDLLRGDPGSSLLNGKPITEIVADSGGYTLRLAAVATLLTYGIALPLGVLAAWKRNSVLDHGTNFLAVLGMGIPNFFLAVLLVQLFSVKLQWLPVAGYETPRHIVLPAVVLAAEAVAINLRVVRSSVLDELSRDYVRTLHAKGLGDGRILWMHVLRNALPPIVALAGIMLRTLLGYTLIVETMFRWPGLGYQLVNAVLKRDYTVAQALALLLTLAVILFNLLADVAQQWADPRVRQGARS